jgi:hypothetical protein
VAALEHCLAALTGEPHERQVRVPLADGLEELDVISGIS